MRKIKLFPSTHVEVRIYVSDEMERDYWECRKAIAVRDKNLSCSNCSWKDVKTSKYSSLGACIMDGLEEQMRGGKLDETDGSR